MRYLLQASFNIPLLLKSKLLTAKLALPFKMLKLYLGDDGRDIVNRNCCIVMLFSVCKHAVFRP